MEILLLSTVILFAMVAVGSLAGSIYYAHEDSENYKLLLWLNSVEEFE